MDEKEIREELREEQQVFNVIDVTGCCVMYPTYSYAQNSYS